MGCFNTSRRLLMPNVIECMLFQAKNVNSKPKLVKFWPFSEPNRGICGITRPFRPILGGSRELPAPPKSVKIPKCPSKKADGRVSS